MEVESGGLGHWEEVRGLESEVESRKQRQGGRQAELDRVLNKETAETVETSHQTFDLSFRSSTFTPGLYRKPQRAIGQLD